MQTVKKTVTVKVQDIDTTASTRKNFGPSDSSLSFGALSSARSSTSSNGEYEAILAMLSGPPLKHKPVFSKIPIVLVVLLISATILLAPVLVVWGINMYNMESLSTSRRDEALLRKAEALYDTIYSATGHCERLIMDNAMWIQTMPRNNSDYWQLVNFSSWGWTMSVKDDQCGNAIRIALDSGNLFLARNSNETSGRLNLADCMNCTEKSYNFNFLTSELSEEHHGGPGGPPPPGPPHNSTQPPPGMNNNLPQLLAAIAKLGVMDNFNQLIPVWGKIAPDNNVLFIELFMGLKRSRTGSNPPVDSDPITGLLKFDIKTYTLTAALKSSDQSGIVGTYVEQGGYIIASTLEDLSSDNQNFTQNNMTNSSQQSNHSQMGNPFGKIILANESEVEIVRESYAQMPTDLSAGESRMALILGFPVAFTKLVSEYGLETFIVTVGDANFFNSFSKASNVASGITLAMSIIAGGLLVAALAVTVKIGLTSIKKAVNWLIEDQLDGSAMILRGEDGEFDHGALERIQNAKYNMKVYFSEMNEVGQSVEQLAVSNRELKAFFPSMFVGMSKDEIKRGAHKTDLRFKNVAVMFVDIVKFSPICAQNEANLQIILQCFFGILESPVFKKKGLTKRLGDGFMAAFGFATPDNDFFELCKRCHECTRLIVKNLPKLNKQLSTRLPFFPEAGIKLRIGLSAGQASIGVVQTDAMSNADVYGGVVNLAQRMEDSGRYMGISSDKKTMIHREVEDTPLCVITMTPEVFQVLDTNGELAKYGIEMQQIEVLVKGEQTPRLAYQCVEMGLPHSTAAST